VGGGLGGGKGGAGPKEGGRAPFFLQAPPSGPAGTLFPPNTPSPNFAIPTALGGVRGGGLRGGGGQGESFDWVTRQNKKEETRQYK